MTTFATYACFKIKKLSYRIAESVDGWDEEIMKAATYQIRLDK